MKWAFGECAWTSVFGSGLDNGPFKVPRSAEKDRERKADTQNEIGRQFRNALRNLPHLCSPNLATYYNISLNSVGINTSPPLPIPLSTPPQVLPQLPLKMIDTCQVHFSILHVFYGKSEECRIHLVCYDGSLRMTRHLIVALLLLLLLLLMLLLS